jgi:hypothetical protein
MSYQGQIKIRMGTLELAMFRTSFNDPRYALFGIPGIAAEYYRLELPQTGSRHRLTVRIPIADSSLNAANRPRARAGPNSATPSTTKLGALIAIVGTSRPSSGPSESDRSASSTELASGTSTRRVRIVSQAPGKTDSIVELRESVMEIENRVFLPDAPKSVVFSLPRLTVDFTAQDEMATSRILMKFVTRFSSAVGVTFDLEVRCWLHRCVGVVSLTLFSLQLLAFLRLLGEDYSRAILSKREAIRGRGKPGRPRRMASADTSAAAAAPEVAPASNLNLGVFGARLAASTVVVEEFDLAPDVHAIPYDAGQLRQANISWIMEALGIKNPSVAIPSRFYATVVPVFSNLLDVLHPRT